MQAPIYCGSFQNMFLVFLISFEKVPNMFLKTHKTLEILGQYLKHLPKVVGEGMVKLQQTYKAGDIQQWFAIVWLCIATLDFLGGLPSKS